jgi:hypothetical protein
VIAAGEVIPPLAMTGEGDTGGRRATHRRDTVWVGEPVSPAIVKVEPFLIAVVKPVTVTVRSPAFASTETLPVEIVRVIAAPFATPPLAMAVVKVMLVGVVPPTVETTV